MACNPTVLRQVPLFALLDDEETCVLAGQVELRTFAPRQRIYKMGDPGDRAYVLVSGSVRVTTVDEDNQEVVVDQPSQGEFFGFASMLERTPHQTNAVALEESECIEVDRNDIAVLLQRKPMAGMDMLTVLGKQFHASQQLVRVRASRNANEVIEEEATLGQRIADKVAGFGGSWTFILTFLTVLVIYTLVNIVLGRSAWDRYPFILLNLFLSMLAAIQAPVIMMSQNRQDTKDRVRSELDFAGDKPLRADQLPPGHPGHHTAIDVFVFNRGMYVDVPPLALGRAWFDQWLIKAALAQQLPVVDASIVAPVLHQNHDYSHVAGGAEQVWRGKEPQENLRLYGSKPHSYTLLDVTHEIGADGSMRRVRLRRPATKIRELAWKLLVQRTVDVRNALRLRRKFWQRSAAGPRG